MGKQTSSLIFCLTLIAACSAGLTVSLFHIQSKTNYLTYLDYLPDNSGEYSLSLNDECLGMTKVAELTLEDGSLVREYSTSIKAKLLDTVSTLESTLSLTLDRNQQLKLMELDLNYPNIDLSGKLTAEFPVQIKISGNVFENIINFNAASMTNISMEPYSKTSTRIISTVSSNPFEEIIQNTLSNYFSSAKFSSTSIKCEKILNLNPIIQKILNIQRSMSGNKLKAIKI